MWGTAGHIDHGKTSLIKALTGTDCDRLPEERERGITIDLGFAQLAADDLQLHFVDVPGHERLVHTMIAGASGIDLALLVIAADEGVMPQTREHLEVIRLMGVRGGAVALTKADLVDDALAELVAGRRPKPGVDGDAASFFVDDVREDVPRGERRDRVSIPRHTVEKLEHTRISYQRHAREIDALIFKVREN